MSKYKEDDDYEYMQYKEFEYQQPKTTIANQSTLQAIKPKVKPARTELDIDLNNDFMNSLDEIDPMTVDWTKL